ncbi:TIGR04141 family sporadically distributed protein [Kitasatospora sp. NPDC050543]|uniref:TIGR04141 family sporadically distributed protein n=1 Tax=Kitasatospora sp. NPDC050543 TaxID=3364054 RepID=UPI0037957D21
MKVSIYLFRDEATTFAELLRDFAPGAPTPEPRELINQVVVPCEVWVMPAQPKPPSWAKALEAVVNISDLKNSSNSVVLFYEVSRRFFAVCFGYGHSLLNHELLESEFGLRVTANMADPEKVATMQVRTVSENSRQQQSQTANKTRAAEFDLQLEREWLRYLKADVTKGLEWATTVGGSQSLSITTTTPLADFSEILEHLLVEFNSQAYKEKFPYIDNFSPVAKGNPILSTLWGELAAALSDPGSSKIGVASPDDLLGADVDHWKINGDRRRRKPLEDLTFESVAMQIPPDGIADALEHLRITPYNAGDAPIRTKRPLRDYFVFECKISNSTCVLCLGQWFRIASEYIEDINRQISEVPDITQELMLPGWNSGDSEGQYNKGVCDQRGYIHLDAKSFMVGGPHQKIEICDFITPEFDFVCVKRMESSATLSHLFSQAAVSAELYSENVQGHGKNTQRYGDHVRDLYRNNWGDLGERENDRRMVLAIATDKSGPLAESLYFFSKVNLVQRLSDLRHSRFRVGLAKIDR